MALLRLAVSVIVALAVYPFVYWVPFSLLPIGEHEGIALVASMACGVAAGGWVWWAWDRVPGTLVSSAAIGALVVGAVGFSLGFFGPIVLAPDANQGPLLGLFITGPAGALLGAIGGIAYWFASRG